MTQPWNYYSQIDLQDLHDPKASAGILLEMKDGHRYFEGRTGVTSAAEQDAWPVSPFTRLPGLDVCASIPVCRLFSCSSNGKERSSRME